MDLKILSGVLITRAHEKDRAVKKGRVVIDFSLNNIVDGDLEPGDLRRERMIAERGMEDWYFDGKPCVTVALREMRVQDEDQHTWPKPSTVSWDNFRINHSVTGQRLTIHWEASGAGSLIEEISYLVIGRVIPPPEGPY